MLLMVAYLLASIPLYTLVAFAKDAPGTEAAMKYLLMGALLGVTMLYGLVWLYGAGGATAYTELADGFGPEVGTAVTLGTVAALAGLIFKLGAVPGHFWVPDVADGAPAPIAAYVTTLPKIAALIATTRLLTFVPEQLVAWPIIVAVVAAATMTLGNLAAFWQDSVRRLLAYSSISQVGYLLMAVAVAGRTELATPALLLYAVAYAVMNLGAFGVIAANPRARTLADYAGLARTRPALAASLTVCLLSLVGIPPLAGFFGKLSVFAAAWDGGYAWLAVLAALNTVASLFYYLRWLAPVYLASAPAQPTAADAQYTDRPTAGYAVYAVYAATILTIVMGATSQTILRAASP